MEFSGGIRTEMESNERERGGLSVKFGVKRRRYTKGVGQASKSSLLPCTSSTLSFTINYHQGFEFRTSIGYWAKGRLKFGLE